MLGEQVLTVEYSLEELNSLRKLVSIAMTGVNVRDDERLLQLDVLYENIAYRTPSFDWNNWNKGQQGLMNADASAFLSDEICDPKITSDSFEEFDQKELGQLLLMIHRVSRFSDGYYEDQIQNGVVLKILDRLISLQK